MYEYSPYFLTWWEHAPKDLHRPSKFEVHKSYQKVMKVWCADNKKEESDFCDHLLMQLNSEIRYRKQKQAAGEFHPAWPHGKTYFNGRRFDAEFVDIPVSQLKQEQDKNLCDKGHEIPRSHNYCPMCYSAKDGILMDALRDSYRKMISNGTRESMIEQYRTMQKSLRRRV